MKNRAISLFIHIRINDRQSALSSAGFAAGAADAAGGHGRLVQLQRGG